MLHFLAASNDSDLYLLWDWMQAIVGLVLDWNPIF